MAGFFQPMPGMVATANGFHPQNPGGRQTDHRPPGGKIHPRLGKVGDPPKSCPKPPEI